MTPSPAVIWHDLECGAYREDLALWRSLAAGADGPVLDVGAGTGRVALDLARAGHDVVALDRDPELLAALERRRDAERLSVRTMLADARDFTLPAPAALGIVPMQTVQLLRGRDERLAFLRCAARALSPGSRLALAIADGLEPFEVADGVPGPLPDVGEFDGTVYSSRPLAIRAEGAAFVLERRRETVSPAGELVAETDLVALQDLTPEQLEDEGRECGFAVGSRTRIATTAEYVGSAVVVLDA